MLFRNKNCTKKKNNEQIKLETKERGKTIVFEPPELCLWWTFEEYELCARTDSFQKRDQVKAKVIARSKYNHLRVEPLKKYLLKEFGKVKLHYLTSAHARLLLITLIFTLYGSRSNKWMPVIIKGYFDWSSKEKKKLLVDLTVGVTVLLKERQRVTFLFIVYCRCCYKWAKERGVSQTQRVCN